MPTEQEILKKDLSKLENKEEIEKFIEDAAMLGHEDIASLAKEKLLTINKKAESIKGTPSSLISQAENLGGSQDEIEKRTGEVDKKIEKIELEVVQKVEEVKNAGTPIEEKVENEKVENLQSFSNAKSFEELFDLIEKNKGVQGSREFLSPKKLREIITDVKDGKRTAESVTRSEDLRPIVVGLIKKDLLSGNYPNVKVLRTSGSVESDWKLTSNTSGNVIAGTFQTDSFLVRKIDEGSGQLLEKVISKKELRQLNPDRLIL